MATRSSLVAGPSATTSTVCVPGSGVTTPSTRLAKETVYLPGTTRAPAPPRPANISSSSPPPAPPPAPPPPAASATAAGGSDGRRQRGALRAQIPGHALQAAAGRGIHAANHFAGRI